MVEISPGKQLVFLLAFVCLCAYFFANVEIQIEGEAGWAANLPTWRVENHWALDLFYSGRPLTGYHFWCFSFMALVFHLPLFIVGRFTWRFEARIIGSCMLFWLVEDFLWFVLNPAYGLGKFAPAHIPWHERWVLGLPSDYWLGACGAALLLYVSYRRSFNE